MGGFEQKFVRLLHDSVWNRVAYAIAVERIMNHCQIEKILYAEARKSRYVGVREIALVYEAAYTQQANAFSLLDYMEPQSLQDVLQKFAEACKPLLRAVGGHSLAYAFRQQASEDLRYRCQHHDWFQQSACESTKRLVDDFLRSHAYDKLKAALLVAQERGHGSYASLSADLERVLADMRLDRLVAHILDGQKRRPKRHLVKKKR